VPSLKTSREPIRTQISDSSGAGVFLSPACALIWQYAPGSRFVPTGPVLRVLGSPMTMTCRKLSITHRHCVDGPGRRPDKLLGERNPTMEQEQSGAKARNWKLTLAYDGTDYRGWQVQPGQVTIQGELQQALARITGEAPLPQGSGRTDAGVHALGQVASFMLAAPIPPENLQRALNRTLPAAIRVMAAEHAPEGFHARHSAVAKTYEYRIFRARICPPFLARLAHHCVWPLAMEELRRAAQAVEGEHDFFSFAATDPDLAERGLGEEAPSAVRRIFSSRWEEQETAAGRLLVYRVRGSGFLHHMVRNLVGTMLEMGRGMLRSEEMARILEAHSRSAAGPTAPARGLFLHSVEYGEDAGSDELQGGLHSDYK